MGGTQGYSPLSDAVGGTEANGALELDGCMTVVKASGEPSRADRAVQGGLQLLANGRARDVNPVVVTASGRSVGVAVGLTDGKGGQFKIPEGMSQLSAVIEPVGESRSLATVVGSPVVALGSADARVELEVRAKPGLYTFRLSVPQLQSI